MGGFLIDTMIWGYWYNPAKYLQQHANIIKRLNDLPSSVRLSISVITWGEIAVGLPKTLPTQHLQFVKTKKPSIIEIDTHIAEEYGKLRNLLAEKGLINKRKKGLSPEELVDRFAWLGLNLAVWKMTSGLPPRP
ncbi:type II toxin-antitoxin system VapC family toxin [Planctomycetota bacterium]